MPLLVDRRVARGRLAQGYEKARRQRRRDSTLRPLASPLNPDETRVERAITSGIREARARVKSARLLEAIRMRSADEIIASVPVEPIRGIMQPIDTVFRDRMVWAATKQGEEFNVRRAFSVVDPEVIRYAGLQAGELINRMTTEQFAALRGAIVDAVAGQFTVDDTAKIIRSSIGLTDRYRKAVEKRYVTVKQTLMGGGQTERAAADAAERMAAKYADKLVRSRARTIARTEINTAQNYGKQIGWEAAYGEGAMSPDTLKEWQISSGACDICRPYSGIRVPVMQPFPTGDLMPPAHPNCRCTANIVSPVRDIIQRLESEQETLDSSLPREGTERIGKTYRELQNQLNWEASLSAEERQAITDYTGKSGKFSANVLNDGLRSRDLTEQQAARVEAIEQATNRAASLNVRPDTTLYRGQTLELSGPTVGLTLDEVRERVFEAARDRYPIGSEINLGRGSFVSTSTDTTPALDASATRTSPGILFEISPTAGAPLQGVTKFDDEYEILLPRDKTFRVVGVHRNQTIIDASLEERVRTVVQLAPID